jgi:hypothetical protein
MINFTESQFDQFTKKAKIFFIDGIQPCNADMADIIQREFPEFTEEQCYNFNIEWSNNHA